GTLAIVDERPGRAVSAAYRQIAIARKGAYVAVDRTEASTLQYAARAAGLNSADLGFNFEKVRTLVSFGAPVLESWGTPGRVLTAWKKGNLAIVQIEAELSKTAALASRWLPVRPAAAAKLASFLAGAVTAHDAAQATG